MVEIRKISDEQLLSQLDKLARSERKITHLVLLHINEVERRKVYLDRGFDGMYSYLTKALGYSDGSAYRRLQAARLLRQVPSIGEKLESGSLNLSQLTEVKKCLDQQMKDQKKDLKNLPVAATVEFNRSTLELLNKLENKNTFQTQQTIATEMKLPLQICEKVQPQRDESIRMEITLTAEQFADLETAKYLLSHVAPEGNWSDIIGLLAKNFNKKKTTGKTMLTQAVVAGRVPSAQLAAIS